LHSISTYPIQQVVPQQLVYFVKGSLVMEPENQMQDCLSSLTTTQPSHFYPSAFVVPLQLSPLSLSDSSYPFTSTSGNLAIINSLSSPEKAFEIFQKIISAHADAGVNHLICTKLIRMLTNKRYANDSLETAALKKIRFCFQYMKTKFHLDTMAYNTMMHALFRFNQPQEAKDIFEQLKQEHKLNSYSYPTLLSHYIRENLVDNVEHLYEEAKNDGLLSSSFFYKIIEYYLYIRHELDKALEFYQQGREKNLLSSEVYWKLIVFFLFSRNELLNGYSSQDRVDMMRGIVKGARENKKDTSIQHQYKFIVEGFLALKCRSELVFFVWESFTHHKNIGEKPTAWQVLKIAENFSIVDEGCLKHWRYTLINTRNY